VNITDAVRLRPFTRNVQFDLYGPQPGGASPSPASVTNWKVTIRIGRKPERAARRFTRISALARTAFKCWPATMTAFGTRRELYRILNCFRLFYQTEWFRVVSIIVLLGRGVGNLQAADVAINHSNAGRFESVCTNEHASPRSCTTTCCKASGD